MISQEMSAALNRHLNNELYSGLLYLSMSSCAGALGFKGAANWFMVQYREEMVHFMKFYAYINSQGDTVRLGPLQAVPHDWKTLVDMFEATLTHEQFITGCINELMDQALREKDHATSIFLQWFITEQIEEEENDRDIIAKLKLIADNSQGLLMLDGELGARQFVPAAGGSVVP
jgi:ferritin